jgi:hypothetical protein
LARFLRAVENNTKSRKEPLERRNVASRWGYNWVGNNNGSEVRSVRPRKNEGRSVMPQEANQEGLGQIFDIIANFIQQLFDMVLGFIEGLLNLDFDDEEV